MPKPLFLPTKSSPVTPRALPQSPQTEIRTSCANNKSINSFTRRRTNPLDLHHYMVFDEWSGLPHQDDAGLVAPVYGAFGHEKGEGTLVGSSAPWVATYRNLAYLIPSVQYGIEDSRR